MCFPLLFVSVLHLVLDLSIRPRFWSISAECVHVASGTKLQCAEHLTPFTCGVVWQCAEVYNERQEKTLRRTSDPQLLQCEIAHNAKQARVNQISV